jgi:ABC-type Na+ transport system ATPase subunit NatA
MAEGLVKRYGDTVALDGIDLAVRTGSVFGLLGPNGAGKTTAVRILATLVRPDGGHASVSGLSLAEPEVRNTTVTVPVSQEDVLPGVMRRFEDAGIRVAELNLRGSSLDEVFLSLNGRRTETEVLEGSAA